MADTHFIKRGSTFWLEKKQNLVIEETLPVGTYNLKFDRDLGKFYLDRTEDFKNPSKLYGHTTNHAGRIVNTFLDRPYVTGVLLTGEKGSGKTLLAKQIGIDCAKIGIPTIVINQPFCGDNFNNMIQSLEQPCVLLFDEFEKVYDRDNQQILLTMLDGVVQSKKLAIMTCNDKWRIDSHMRNRPGRLYYAIDFNGLDVDFIREYCEDNLNNKSHIPGLLKISSLYSKFNFDMLKAMVEEMNRYNEQAHEVVALLNVRPEDDGEGRFDLRLFYKGKEMSNDAHHIWPRQYQGNPTNLREFSVSYNVPVNDEHYRDVIEFQQAVLASIQSPTPRGANASQLIIEQNRNKPSTKANVPAIAGDKADCEPECDDDDRWKEYDVHFSVSGMTSIDPATGAFTFKSEEDPNVTLVFERKRYTTFDYSAL